MRPEGLFREDVINLLKTQIQDIGCNIESSIKILKDIILTKKENQYQIQFGFFDQDIVIYKDKMPTSEVKWIRFHNTAEKENIVIPLVIVEVKLHVGSHTIIAYSEIARDIKNIFPFVKYYLLIRGTTKEEELLRRHGRNFDGIFKLENTDYRGYKKGTFQQDLMDKPVLKNKFEHFLEKVKSALDTCEQA